MRPMTVLSFIGILALGTAHANEDLFSGPSRISQIRAKEYFHCRWWQMPSGF